MKESVDVNLLTGYVLIKCKRNRTSSRWSKVASEKDIELLTYTDTISVIIIGYMKEITQKKISELHGTTIFVYWFGFYKQK